MIEDVKSNIFSDEALPILYLKNILRDKILEIRNRRAEWGEEGEKI